MKRWFALVCGLALSSLFAQTELPLDHAAAYARIDAERAREGAAFDAQDSGCYQRFAVSTCLKAVQTKRIAVMNALRRQEAVLHDAERRQQGVDQLQRLGKKAEEKTATDAQAQKDADALAAEDKLQAQQEKRTEHAAKATTGSAAPLALHETSAPNLQEQSLNRDSYARKLADAEKKRQSIAKQRSDRTGKPLPTVPSPN